MDSLGSRLTLLEETTSTNDAVRDVARADGFGPGASPIWLAARRQVAGRGRRGRAWVGVEGNLFLSGMLWIDAPLERAAQLAFAGALAVADLLDPVVGPDAVRFKWPNDVLLGEAKVAGVLLESAFSSASRDGSGVALVVGMGVNLAAAPEVGRPATALAAHVDAAAVPEVETAARRLAMAFEARAAAWARDGFAALRDPWLARCAHLGRRMRAGEPGQPVEGVFEDVDDQGRLVLRQGTQRVLIHAGDVTLAPDEGGHAAIGPARPGVARHAEQGGGHASGH